MQPLAWGGNGIAAETDLLEPLLRSELVVVDERGRRRSALPVSFTDRVRGENIASLLGIDPSGSLHVALEATIPATTLWMRFRFQPGPTATPLDLRPIIGWLESLAPGRKLGLWMPEKGRWAAEPHPIPSGIPTIPSGYAGAVRVLARIQERAGASFVMPENVDEDLAKDLGVADKLVRGETASGRWRDVSINDDPQLLGYLKSSEHGALLEFTTDFILEIDGASVAVGQVEYRFMQVTLAGHDKNDGVIRLVPGHNDRFDVRLVAVPERVNPDGATSWLPTAMLEPYKDKWIAQSGTKILLSGHSFEEVTAAVRAHGRLATVWRVPASREGAEMLYGIS